MSGPFVIAVPAKGRLQEHTDAFFARAGLELVKPRGERDYRGAVKGLPGVEVAYLSASEITLLLAQGAVHFGVTGEDLVREEMADPDAKVVLIEALGFGEANVVVAVPQAWIDVYSMADLDDVATAFRIKHDRKMRVATKYLNLTRGFFSKHGITDYRIVESAGATEAAPGTGTAELIVDITSTGSTLAANGLKIDCNETLLAEARERFGVAAPLGGPTSSGMLTLHCPPSRVHALASFLRDKGAQGVTVTGLDYVFARDNPLYAKLDAGLKR
jgi:ATP phosphoribosyltransferase